MQATITDSGCVTQRPQAHKPLTLPRDVQPMWVEFHARPSIHHSGRARSCCAAYTRSIPRYRARTRTGHLSFTVACALYGISETQFPTLFLHRNSRKPDPGHRSYRNPPLPKMLSTESSSLTLKDPTIYGAEVELSLACLKRDTCGIKY